MTRRPKTRKANKPKATMGRPIHAEEGHPSELFHYTNLGALRGILTSNVLWATSADAIPYIRLFEGFGDPLPITRIIVGPSRMRRAVFEEVQDLVRGRGIVIQASEIPYVGSV